MSYTLDPEIAAVVPMLPRADYRDLAVERRQLKDHSAALLPDLDAYSFCHPERLTTLHNPDQHPNGASHHNGRTNLLPICSPGMLPPCSWYPAITVGHHGSRQVESTARLSSAPSRRPAVNSTSASIIHSPEASAARCRRLPMSSLTSP